jgi:hypothetical protein
MSPRRNSFGAVRLFSDWAENDREREYPVERVTEGYRADPACPFLAAAADVSASD